MYLVRLALGLQGPLMLQLGLVQGIDLLLWYLIQVGKNLQLLILLARSYIDGGIECSILLDDSVK